MQTGVRFSALFRRKGRDCACSLWSLPLAAEAYSIPQRLLPVVWRTAPRGADPDIQRRAHLLHSDPAGGILEALALHDLWPRSACDYKNPARVQMGRIVYPAAFYAGPLGPADRTGFRGLFLDSQVRLSVGSSPHSRSSAPHKKRAISGVETCSDSARVRHRVSVLWRAIADACLADLVPCLRRRQDLTQEISVPMLSAFFNETALELAFARASSEFRLHTVRFPTGRQFRESIQISPTACPLYQTSQAPFLPS